MLRHAALCWGQRWSWSEHQTHAAERTATLILSQFVDAPPSAQIVDVRSAVRLVIGRHEALRATFGIDDSGRPRQEVWPAGLDLYQFEQFDRESDCLAWLRRPFDLSSAWPLRIAVLHLAGGGIRLGVATHHIAADFYGFDLLCQELSAALRATADRVALSLPSAGRQPVDLAAFEQSPAGAAVNDRAMDHWTRQDDDLGEVLGLLRARFEEPSEVMYVARVTSTGRPRSVDLPTVRPGIESAVAVAAVACALAGYLGRSQVSLAMGVSNRHLEGLRQSVCCVTQSGLVSVQVPDPRRVEGSLPSAWAGMLAGMRHAHYDHDELFERMKSLDTGCRHSTVAPPSINIARVGSTVPGLTPVSRPDLGDERFTTSLGQCDRRCLGLHFHLQGSAEQLSVELRSGAHLLSMDECHQLAVDVLTSIIG
jgi:hypothetical protein